MVAPTRFAAGLLSSVHILTEEQRLQLEDGGKDCEMDEEMAVERDDNHLTGASHAIIIIIVNNNIKKEIDSNDDINNDNSNNDNNNDYNNNNGNTMPTTGLAAAVWMVTGCFQMQRHGATIWGWLTRRTRRTMK